MTNGALRIDFSRHLDFPCIAGIVIDGTTKAVNQLAGQPFTRKINCGGPGFKDYEADRLVEAAMTVALTVRISLARAWEKLLSFQTAACDIPGELGTIANLEQHSRRKMHLLDAHDQEIAAALGMPLPAEAKPSARFDGSPRIIVPTVRTSVAAGPISHSTTAFLGRCTRPIDGDKNNEKFGAKISA